MSLLDLPFEVVTFLRNLFDFFLLIPALIPTPVRNVVMYFIPAFSAVIIWKFLR